MTPHQFFYPCVVVEFYQIMASRRDRNPTALHFSIDGREGILQASDIATTFNLLIALTNYVDYRKRPHPSPREMVHILSRDTSACPILFRRQLPTTMLFMDHVLQSNLFPLQHLVQRRKAIPEALYHIFKGFWFNPVELIMTYLFHFEEKIHCKNLTRVEAIPLNFSLQLCQVLEHLGFPTEPHLERRQVCEAIFKMKKWQFVSGAPPLPLKDPAEDQPPLAASVEEPHIPASTVPTSTSPLPA